jgi:hypothetical protein
MSQKRKELVSAAAETRNNARALLVALFDKTGVCVDKNTFLN